jgi:enoyl-CoA hydratase
MTTPRGTTGREAGPEPGDGAGADVKQGGPVLLDWHPLAPDGTTAALITLNRPDQLNAIDWAMLTTMDRAIDAVAGSRDVRILMITGAGRGFSAGGDLKQYIDLQRDAQRFPRFVADFHRVLGRLRELPTPTVALVNGITAAGGLELLLACDLVIAAESAQIGDGHLNYGQMGGGGVLTMLPRIVGIQRASEMVFFGRFLSSAEALAWGLVGRVVPDAELLAAGLSIGNEVATKSPLAVANAKYVMNTVWRQSLSVDMGLALELERNTRYCLTSEDAPEGLRAFAEKREPRYRGV